MTIAELLARLTLDPAIRKQYDAIEAQFGDDLMALLKVRELRIRMLVASHAPDPETAALAATIPMLELTEPLRNIPPFA